jgi:CBS domain containing-hemolysin-like protein
MLLEAALLFAFGLFLLLLNGFFVLAEFAVVKVRSSRIEELVQAGHPRAPLLKQIHDRLDEYLSVCQVGITLASVALGMVGEQIADMLGASDGSVASYIIAIGVSYVLISGSHIVIGELVPKSIAIRIADKAALWSALPLRFFHALFFIPLWILNHIAWFFLRLLGFPGRASEGEHSEDELRIILDRSQSHGLLSFRRLLFIENVFDLGDLKVRDAMRPRSQIKVLHAGRPWRESHEIIRLHRYSRYPLIADDPDKPIGIVHLKDILLRPDDAPAEPDLAALVRPFISIRDTAPLEQTLAEMQRRRLRVALVTDEGGRWTGLLSLEDVIEEIVGTINDEFERDEAARVADAISPARVVLDVQAASLMEAIPAILARVPAEALPLPREQIRKALLERERAAATYLGHGIAMPHARLAGLDRPAIIVANAPNGIAIEGGQERARILFLLLTPAGAPKVHQRLQATLATMLENSDYVADRLRDAVTPEQVVEILVAGEQATLG